MTGDERLELDDDGQVLGSTSVVDLSDPEATDTLAASALDSWVVRSAAPWVTRHRPAVLTVVGALSVALLAGAWWTSRPEPPPAAPALVLEDAPTRGGDLGGPRIDADGHLTVAYTATADRGVARVDILDLVGPGLRSAGVDRGDATLAAGASGFVQLAAQVQCGDPALATATTSSYGLRIRSTDSSGDAVDSVQSFTGDTTALESAVRDRCVTTELPPLVSVTAITLTGTPGSSVVDAVLDVRNDSGIPATVASERVTTDAVEVDLSPTILVPQHGSAQVPTRLLLHDCSAASSLTALADLPNPVSPRGYVDQSAAPGITLRLGIADRTALSSYALPRLRDELAGQLSALACAGRPTLSATLVDVQGQAQPGGGWSVSGTYDLRTSGVGVTLGREHFTGPALGQGSSLATTDTAVPGLHWALAPTQLDGGAGRVPVVYSGSSCADAVSDIPRTIAVRVTMPDHSVYPFEVPLDRSSLATAISRACGAAGVSSVIDPATGLTVVTVA